MVLVCAQEILLVQVYWPLSQDNQIQLGNRFNLEFRLFIQTVQNKKCVYSYFMFKKYNSTKSVIQPIKYVIMLCYQLVVSKYISK